MKSTLDIFKKMEEAKEHAFKCDRGRYTKYGEGYIAGSMQDLTTSAGLEPRLLRDPGHFYGEKYDPDLEVADIIKLVRADLKAEFPGVKFSVRKRRVTHSLAIDVEIKKPWIRIINPEHVRFGIENPHGPFPSLLELPRYLPDAKKMLDGVKKTANAYNFDKSDAMSDYFHVNYYNDTVFDYEIVRTETEYLTGLIKAGAVNVSWQSNPA